MRSSLFLSRSQVKREKTVDDCDCPVSSSSTKLQRDNGVEAPENPSHHIPPSLRRALPHRIVPLDQAEKQDVVVRLDHLAFLNTAFVHLCFLTIREHSTIIHKTHKTPSDWYLFEHACSPILLSQDCKKPSSLQSTYHTLRTIPTKQHENGHTLAESMVVSKIPDAMLRPIKLTPEETEMLIQEAERIISETLAASNLFITNDRYLPKSEWKHVKTKEHVQVYRTRKRKSRGLSPSCSESFSSPVTTECGNDYRSRSKAWGKGNGGSSSKRPAATSSCSDSSSGSSASCDRTIFSNDFTVEINRTKPVGLPLMIATGTIPGTVEDLAFGALAYNERLTRHRDTHLEEKYEGVKVLATIVRPTAQDPFQSLVVKWTYRNISALSRMRDRVFIEANGIMIDSNGNEVAYHLIHSIDSIPRIPGFKHLDIMRANLSMYYITRQFDQSSVEVFCRGFADPGGVFAESIASYVFTDLVLSVVHVVDCAYIKKLIWFTHKKRQCNPASNSRSQSPASHCTNCTTSLTTFGNLIHTSTACRACRQEICGKCSVTKKVAVEASSTEVRLKTVTYCLHCVIGAKQASAAEAALTLAKRFDPEWNGIAQARNCVPLHVVGDSAMIIKQQQSHHPPKNAKLVKLYHRSKRLADTMCIRSWKHHYRAHNKMADLAANHAMNTKSSAQYAFPTTRPTGNEIEQLMSKDVTHWFDRFSDGTSCLGATDFDLLTNIRVYLQPNHLDKQT